MTNRPSGPVVPARNENLPFQFLTICFLACFIPAMAIICVKAIQKVRADNRVAAACERIADAMEGNIPPLPLVPPEVEVRDIKHHDRMDGMGKAAERAVKMTDKGLAAFEKDLNVAERETIQKLAGQLQGFRNLDRVIAPAADKNHVAEYCRDVEYVRDGKVYPEVCR